MAGGTLRHGYDLYRSKSTSESQIFDEKVDFSQP